MNKETVARQQITIADVRDGEKGAKGDTGTAAEFYHLQPMEETALVGVDNVLRVKLSYTIEHVKGTQVTTEAGSAQGYHVTARMNNGVTIAMTNGAMNSGAYKITSYSKAQNRPGYVIIELKDKANKVVDTRTVQIIMESASYVDVVGDLRTTVSQQGKNITTIKQTADSISLKVDGIKNGVKNLLKGGKYEKTFSSYGFTKEAKVIKLKPQTTYTLTMCGRVSADAITKKQTLQGYVVSDGWKFSAGGANLEINTPTDSVVSFTFTTPTSDKLPNDGLCFFDAYPTPNKEPQARNADVTVNWVTVTEGTQAAASWIPADGETGEDKAKEVELRLENGEFRVNSDKTVFVDNTGKETVLIEGGKLSATLIDAVKIVAAGIQAQEIDAKEAKFKNLTVTGDSTFEGTINTNKGTIAGWKILHGMIGYGKDSDGLSLLDTCLIYNYRNRKRQVIVGEDPKTKISYGADTMLALRNNTRESVRNIGVFIDVAPDKDFVFRDNFAILALRGTYAGFRRKLEVVSDDYTIKKEDSSILFTGRVKKLFTLPSDPEDGEEFTIYSAYGQDIDLKTNDGTSIEGDATAPRIRENGHLSALRCTYRIVFSMVRKTWFIFVQ